MPVQTRAKTAAIKRETNSARGKWRRLLPFELRVMVLTGLLIDTVAANLGYQDVIINRQPADRNQLAEVIKKWTTDYGNEELVKALECARRDLVLEYEHWDKICSEPNYDYNKQYDRAGGKCNATDWLHIYRRRMEYLEWVADECKL